MGNSIIITNARTLLLLLALILAIPTFGLSLVAWGVWIYWFADRGRAAAIAASAYADMDENGWEMTSTWARDISRNHDFSSRVKSAAASRGVPISFLSECLEDPDNSCYVYGYAACMEQRGASFRQQIIWTAAMLHDKWQSLTPRERAVFMDTARPSVTLPSQPQQKGASGGAVAFWSLAILAGMAFTVFAIADPDGAAEEAYAEDTLSYEDASGDMDYAYDTEDYMVDDSMIDNAMLDSTVPEPVMIEEEYEIPGAKAPELPYSAPPVDYGTIEKGVLALIDVHIQSGMTGAREYSKKCRKAADAWPTFDRYDFCNAFDMAASNLDQVKKEESGAAKDTYFAFMRTNSQQSYGTAAAYHSRERLTVIERSVPNMLTTLDHVEGSADAGKIYLDIPAEGKPSTGTRLVPQSVYPSASPDYVSLRVRQREAYYARKEADQE